MLPSEIDALSTPVNAGSKPPLLPSELDRLSKAVNAKWPPMLPSEVDRLAKPVHAPADIADTDAGTKGGVITEVNSADHFDRLVAETSADDSVLVVKFYYTTCRACKAMAPRFRQYAKEYSELGRKIRFAEVEAVKHRDIADALGVTVAPSIQIYVHSKKEEDFSIGGPKKVKILKQRLQDYAENGIAAVAHSSMHLTDKAVETVETEE
jgi:thioredoxin-like negative regulator of GroEL